jgi:predicted regulator of Ras-like GTPase activity (Roadblock/LC7/MglB family)
VRPGQDLNWLITAFADRVPHIAHALVVSSDGLPLAFSKGLPPDRVDQLAAVTSGLTSLVDGASRIFEGGPVSQTVVEMRQGLLIVMSVPGGSSLTVLAGADCDMGLVAYEMALLADRTWRALTPEPREPGAPLPPENSPPLLETRASRPREALTPSAREDPTPPLRPAPPSPRQTLTPPPRPPLTSVPRPAPSRGEAEGRPTMR